MPLNLALGLQKSTYDELHARPFIDIASPAHVYSVTVFFDNDTGQQLRNLLRLTERFGLPAPSATMRSYAGHASAMSLHWSLHTEFARYTIVTSPDLVREMGSGSFCEASARDWLEDLDGILLTASLLILASDDGSSSNVAASGGEACVGAGLEDEGGSVETDMRLQYADGCEPGFVVYRIGTARMGPEQAGRAVQRLVEIDTYLALALLSLPIAHAQVPELDRIGIDLRELVVALGDAAQGEYGLLARLEKLAADLERLIAISQYRFSASCAYYELVDVRLSELPAPRREGVEYVRDFILRRLTPAMATCRAVERRQENLAARIERAAALLRARQEARHQELNRALLARTAKNGELQVRLQEMVEGLSVWVLTYYVTGLAAYPLKALHGLGLGLDFDVNIVLGAAIPFIAALTWLGLHRAKNSFASLAADGAPESGRRSPGTSV